MWASKKIMFGPVRARKCFSSVCSFNCRHNSNILVKTWYCCELRKMVKQNWIFGPFDPFYSFFVTKAITWSARELVTTYVTKQLVLISLRAIIFIRFIFLFFTSANKSTNFKKSQKFLIFIALNKLLGKHFLI